MANDYAMVPIGQQNAVVPQMMTIPVAAPPGAAVVPQMMTIAVAAPPGAVPGQLIQVQVPGTGQVVQARVPTGLPPQGTFQIQVPAPTGVVTTQPMATGPSPEQIQAQVHETVRNGFKAVHSSDAWAYSKSLTPQQAAIANVEGCHYCVPVECPGFPGCFCTFNYSCCENGLCFPCCCMGLCCPLFSCVCCSCERRDNAWITRDKHGRMTGAIIIVDHEKGTLAHYATRCCSDELEPAPQCYCAKV